MNRFEVDSIRHLVFDGVEAASSNAPPTMSVATSVQVGICRRG